MSSNVRGLIFIFRVFHEVATKPLPTTIDLNDLVCDFEVKKEEDFENQTEEN
jgi:hypothetical protein